MDESEVQETLLLSPPQASFLALDTRFTSFVGGFGSGKTFIGCVFLMITALAHPGVVMGYFAPIFSDIRDTFWPTIEEVAEIFGCELVVKRADQEVHIWRDRSYYGKIICRSMDRPEKIVGFKIAVGHVDEIDTLSADKATLAWNKIIARLRMSVPGLQNRINVTTTPEGFGFVYEKFKRAPTADYSMVQASTLANAKFLPEGYIQSLRDTYPEQLIDAYLDGEFVNLTSGTVYSHYDRDQHRSWDTVDEDDRTLHIGQDFNVGQMASVVFVERANGYHAVDELKEIEDTPALIDVLKDRYGSRKLIIYPDASGDSRKTVNASKTDIRLLKEADLKVRVDASNPRVKDRILAVNTGFTKGRLHVNDAACPVYAECLERQVYDKNGEPDKTAGFDHHPDAGGYAVQKIMPVNRPNRKAVVTRYGSAA